MLYLAEVHKKAGFMGGNKAELKLLARQQSEQSWVAVPNEEMITADEASNYNAGALVLLELSSTRQIQNIQEAAKQLVGILQNFSRRCEKFRTQEEEIEGWKQSLIYQSQELTRRELELETRQEELLQLEEEAQNLEQQRQDMERLREEAQTMREAVERDRQELEGAWDHLRGEIRRLEERQAQQSAVLDAEQVRRIDELLTYISTVLKEAPGQGQWAECLTLLAAQQTVLDHHWQGLEQNQEFAQTQQAAVDHQAAQLETLWQEWHRSQDSLSQAQVELKLQQQALSLKEENAQMLGLQAQRHEDLYQQLSQLGDGSGADTTDDKVDLQALLTMPIADLKALVETLQQDLEKMSRFVNDQEEELALQHQTIEEVQQKIEQANEFDRLSLEGDLEFERQSYEMLNETLVGQRRSLREREEVLERHQAVLLRRQGQGPAGEIDLKPVLTQLESQRQQQAEELQKLENQVDQIRAAIQQMQTVVQQQSKDQDAQHTQLKQQDLELHQQKTALAELQGRINSYSELLQPLQERVNELRQRLETGSGDLQGSGDEPLQAIATMRDMIMAFAQTPELAAS